jgi:transmembrane sensor
MIREVLTLDRLSAMAPDAAAALLAARRLMADTPDDGEALTAWLARDPAHARAWTQAQRAVSAFDDAQGDDIVEAMLLAARAHRPAPLWPRLAAAAAAAVVLALSGLAVFEVQGDRGGPPTVIAQTDVSGPATRTPDFSTRKGEHGDFVLPDGSRMTLDTDSAVELAFGADRRTLRLLRGRGYFDVVHDASRPFTVLAADQAVVALGTRFDVRLDPGQLRVVLVEGRVAVGTARDKTPRTVLRPGEQLVQREDGSRSISSANVEETTNWRAGLVTFRGDTLAAAAAELNRYSATRLTVRDPAVAQLRVTGVFKAGDPARFGRTLSQIYPVRIVSRGPGELEILPAL